MSKIINNTEIEQFKNGDDLSGKMFPTLFEVN